MRRIYDYIVAMLHSVSTDWIHLTVIIENEKTQINNLLKIKTT